MCSLSALACSCGGDVASPTPARADDCNAALVAMSLPSASISLQEVFAQAGVPEEVAEFLRQTCMIQSVEDFLGFVVKKQYEEEWRQIISDRFPTKEARAATATEPAQTEFTIFSRGCSSPR